MNLFGQSGRRVAMASPVFVELLAVLPESQRQSLCNRKTAVEMISMLQVGLRRCGIQLSGCTNRNHN